MVWRQPRCFLRRQRRDARPSWPAGRGRGRCHCWFQERQCARGVCLRRVPLDQLLPSRKGSCPPCGFGDQVTRSALRQLRVGQGYTDLLGASSWRCRSFHTPRLSSHSFRYARSHRSPKPLLRRHLPLKLAKRLALGPRPCVWLLPAAALLGDPPARSRAAPGLRPAGARPPARPLPPGRNWPQAPRWPRRAARKRAPINSAPVQERPHSYDRHSGPYPTDSRAREPLKIELGRP